MTHRVIDSQVEYFHGPSADGTALEQVVGNVYTFHAGFDRTLVVVTSEGLVVVDTFGPHLTRPLLTALARAGLPTRTNTVIYSHYHLDHVRGAEVLAPEHVVAHERCAAYWQEHGAMGIVPPTQTVAGDTTLKIGGVEISLVYLERGHTDTLFAVHLPAERVLYAADQVAIRTLLPLGGVSLYWPAYLRGLDRMKALRFDTFVSSHFGWGPRAGFDEAVQLQHDVYDWVGEAMAHHAGLTAAHLDPDHMNALYDEVAGRLRDRYGSWHGFDAMLFPTIVSVYTAEYVGD